MRISILSLFISVSMLGQHNQFISSQGKKDLILEEKEYDQTQGHSVESAHTSYMYQMGGDQLHQILYNQVDSNGVLGIVAKETMEYGPQNRITKVAEEELNDQGTLYLSSEMLYEYNQDNQPIEIKRISYDPDDGTSEMDRKYVFTYQQGQVQQIQWHWGSSLTLLFVDNFTYDASNKLTEYLRTDAAGNSVDRKTYQYDPTTGKCTGYIWEKYTNGAWNNYYKVKYSYDINNENMTEEISYLHNNGVWKENIKREYIYNPNMLASETYLYKDYSYYLGLHEWIDNTHAVAMTKLYSYDHHPSVNNWKYTKNIETIYADKATYSVKENAHNPLNNITLYPNPAQDYFKITTNEPMDKIHLIDASGRIVKKYDAKDKQFSVQGVQKGVYTVVIFGKKSTKSKQLIIQ